MGIFNWFTGSRATSPKGEKTDQTKLTNSKQKVKSTNSSPFNSYTNGRGLDGSDPTFDVNFLNNYQLNQKVTNQPYLINRLYSKLGVVKKFIDEPINISYRNLNVKNIKIDGQSITDDLIEDFNYYLTSTCHNNLIKSIKLARLYGCSKVAFKVKGKNGTIGLDFEKLSKVDIDGLLILSNKDLINSKRTGLLIENDIDNYDFVDPDLQTGLIIDKNQINYNTLSSLEPVMQAINSWYLCLNITTELVSEKKVSVIEVSESLFNSNDGSDISDLDAYENTMAEIERISLSKSFKDTIAIKEGLDYRNVEVNIGDLDKYYNLIKLNLSSSTGLTSSWLLGESNDGLRSTDGDMSLIQNYCENIKLHFNPYINQIITGLACSYFKSSQVRIELSTNSVDRNEELDLLIKEKTLENM